MRAEDLLKPSVPVAYGLLILDVAERCGLPRAELLKGMNIPAAVLDTPDARISLVQAGQMLYRALMHSPQAGYEIGLHSNLTTHGFIGYGLLTNPTPRQALEFGARFLQLRLPNLRIELRTEGAHAVIEVTETTPQGAVRRGMFDLFLVGIARIAQQMMGGGVNAAALGIELWFDYPEPPYFAQYRERLPPARFSMRANQLRFPAAQLDRALATADPVTAKLVTQQCENELAVLGYTADFTSRVRALLVLGRRGGYPGLEATARKLNLPADRLVVTVDEHSNTSAASIPLALDHAVRTGQIQRGQTLMLEGVGGGFTWGAVLLDF